MNQQNDRSSNLKSGNENITSKIKNSIPSMDSVKGAVTGTTGITILSAAAVGVAGYLLWRNRESIKTFAGKYVDLPNFITGEESSEDSLTHSKSANLGRSNYSTSPSTSHRM